MLRDGAPAMFVSPHLDDAVLSCAALMRAMARGRPSRSSRVLRGRAAAAHPRRAGRSCASAGRATPRHCSRNGAEDVEVLDDLGIRHVHLGHPDALFRRRRDPFGLLGRAGRVLPELDHRYPTFRFDIDLGRVSRGDRRLLEEITAR